MSPISLWLADYQLRAAALLLGVMLAIAALRQPAQRLAVAKSTLAALAALALLVALPGWSLVHLLNDDAATAEPAALRTEPTPAFNSTLSTIEPTPDLFNTQPLESPATGVLHTNSRDEVEPTSPISWSTYLITAYAAVSAAVTLWLITGALLAHRVRRQATPAPPELQALLQQLYGHEKRAPQLLISNRITAPVALGLRRPTILLPPSALPLHPSQLLPILAHEWAHLQHRDLHTLAATRLLLILLWPQPLYWLLRRTIRLDQETLADAAAADRAGRLDYAQQLLAWAGHAGAQHPPRLAGAVGLWEGPSQLKRRIAVLLNEQFNVMRSCSRRWRGGSLATLALLAIGLSTVTFQPQAGVADEAGEETTKVESTTEATAVATPPSDAAAGQDPMVAYLGHRETDNKTPNVIRGRCLDEANQPIADVEVELYRGKRPSGLQRLVTQTKTNAAGEFEFRDVVDPQKSFPDGVVPANHVSNTEMLTVITRQPRRASREVLADAPYTYREGRSVDVFMPPAASLAGIIKDDAGRPIAGARVSRNGLSDFPQVFSAVTDAQGRFSIDDLAPFELAAEKKRQADEKKSTDAQLTAGAHAVLTTSLAPRFTVVHPEFSSKRLPPLSVPSNVEVTLAPGARLRGRVIFADGSPAANATVQIKPSIPKRGNGDWGMIDYGKFNIERDYLVAVQTDAEGRFEAGSLTPGKLDVWAELPGWLNAGVGEFEVKAGPAASIPDLTLTKGGVIRLQLIDDETGRPIAVDEPLIANVSVIMKNKLGRQETWPDRKKVSDQGIVEIASLPGTAQVMLQSVEAGAEPQWLPAANNWTAYPQAQVVEGNAVDAELRVRRAPTTNTNSTNGIGALKSSPKPDGEKAAIVTPKAEVTARKNELLRGVVREKNSVRGYCVDEHGKPLAGAKISLFDYRSSDHAGRPHVFRETLSDQRGYFSIDAAIDVEQAKLDGIPVDKPFDSANGWDTITINAHAPGRAASYDHIPTVLLVQDGDLRMFELRPGKSLSGKVTDATGRPVAGVQVTAGGYSLSSATTDAKGNYEIRDLYPMDGTPGHQLTPVEFRHPDFALQKAGPATVPGKLDVTLQPGGTIEGRIEIREGESFRLAANVDVMIARFAPVTPTETSSSRVLGTQYSRIFDREWVRTNDAGEYRMQSLSPGDHGVTIVQNELVTNGVAPITVKPQEAATAPPTILTSGARIRVKLIDAETKQPIPFNKQARGAANPILSSPTIPSMQLRRELKPYGDFGEINVAPGKFSLFVAIPKDRLTSVHDRLPTGDFPPYHEFRAEEGEDLEFVIPMRVKSTDSATPFRPAPTPGILIEGLDDVPEAEGAPGPVAPPGAKPTPETRHQTMGQGAFVAVPLEPKEPSTENANKLAIGVVDEQGAPLTGVEALIYRVSRPQGEHVLDRSVATDANGKIVADNLVPPAEVERFQKLKAAGGFIYDGSKGGYVIVLRRAGLATALIFQSPGDLALYGAYRTIKMRPAVKLSGRVTDPAGKPVAGARVVAGDSFVGGFAIDGVNATTTDAQGRYEFADRAAFNRAESNKKQNQFLAASLSLQASPLAKDPAAAEDPSTSGVSNLLVSHPDYAVTRVEGGDVPGVTDVQLLPATSISGRVVQHGSGAPAAGITVHAAGFPDVSQGAPNEMRIRSGHSAVTTTDATGAYRFSNLPTARYDVWADFGAQEMSDAPWVSRGQSRIEALPGGEPAKVPDLIIGPPAIVQVQLVDAESGESVELPAGATANLAPQRVDGPSMQQTPLQRVSTTTDGKFDMRLFPGRSRVLLFIHEGEVGSPAIWQTDDDVDSTGEVFDLKPGETISATIKVLPTARVNELRERDMAANKLMEEKKYAEAIAAYSSLIADFPKNHFRLLQQRGHAFNRLGDYAAALADFEASLKLAPDNTGTKFFIASLLATTPVDADRDSRRALEYAEQLAALARQQDDSQNWLASILDIQASAHADLGEFDEAVQIEEEAIELSHESQREAMKSRLELYQTNKPFRREAPAPATTAPAEKSPNQGASTSPPLYPLATKAVQFPPASPTTTRAVAVSNPTAGLTQLETLDLQFPSDATWHLIP